MGSIWDRGSQSPTDTVTVHGFASATVINETWPGERRETDLRAGSRYCRPATRACAPRLPRRSCLRLPAATGGCAASARATPGRSADGRRAGRGRSRRRSCTCVWESMRSRGRGAGRRSVRRRVRWTGRSRLGWGLGGVRGCSRRHCGLARERRQAGWEWAVEEGIRTREPRFFSAPP